MTETRPESLACDGPRIREILERGRAAQREMLAAEARTIKLELRPAPELEAMTIKLRPAVAPDPGLMTARLRPRKGAPRA